MGKKKQVVEPLSEEGLAIVRAIARANGHPDPSHFEARVVAAHNGDEVLPGDEVEEVEEVLSEDTGEAKDE